MNASNLSGNLWRWQLIFLNVYIDPGMHSDAYGAVFNLLIYIQQSKIQKHVMSSLFEYVVWNTSLLLMCEKSTLLTCTTS